MKSLGLEGGNFDVSPDANQFPWEHFINLFTNLRIKNFEENVCILVTQNPQMIPSS